MDVYTKRGAETSEIITNHGISETDTDVFTPGISSLIMFILWISIIVTRKLSLGLDNLKYFIIEQPDYLHFILQLTGMTFVFLGVLLANWSRILRGVNSPNWGFKERSILITNGPYRYIRHPSYTFYILVCSGIAILTQIWFVYLLIFGVSRYTNVVKVEEKMLRLQFGAEYEDYQAHTKKFLPFIW